VKGAEAARACVDTIGKIAALRDAARGNLS